MPSTFQNAFVPNEIGIHPPKYRLPADAHVGRVRLAVSNLGRSLTFYSRVIGLSILNHGQSFAQLGARGSKEVLLELDEVAGVTPITRRSRLGLYHTAFLLPTRKDLSSFVRHLVAQKIDFGSGDHLYSEALYLTDPDGLSVEVYADRPRETWTYEGREIVSATNPVRFGELPQVAEDSWQGAPTGTTVGHVHMYIGDLDKAAAFYNGVLGLDIVTWRYPGALFASAGGYHHHIGLNIWAEGSPPSSAEDARLLFWELVLPSEREREQLLASLREAGYTSTRLANGTPCATDPWGITVALVITDPVAGKTEIRNG
ncbi:catechol 2,3-dioxygenase [Granulicella aggregans]|uniref:Catechol 2,3-dioxygenase n=1 Tax=Granulicella aggregans TaxID=474949 RepID=A0A7W8E547_9BACT|nr:VOC family protein [Granulicella aggregans]MBB5059312.1 catechol 2,3-dioxygenase [Granulicella aggregans]